MRCDDAAGRVRRLAGAMACVVALVLPAAAQADPVTDAFDQALQASGTPGATAAIAVDGQVVWHAEGGLADVAAGRPMTAGTVFDLASISKTFTAAMTMRLAEQGLIDLDAPVSRYAPHEFPHAGTVTVRELLGQESGLVDYLNDPPAVWIGGWFTNQPGMIAHLSAANVLGHAGTLLFPPGTQWRYSNTGYVVLGDIIRRVTGHLSDQELRDLITGPLGLSHTTLAPDPSPLGPLAHPYSVIQAGAGAVDVFARSPKMPSAYFGPVWTDRGVASTAGDVATFEDDLYGGRLLQPGSLQQMLTADLNPMYGLGTLIDPTIPGHLLVGHDGHMPGFTTLALRDQGAGFTLAVLTNSDPYPGGTGSAVGDIWVAVYLAWLRQHGIAPTAGQRALTASALTDLAR